MLWFDAHLDLAYLAVNGRDMLAPLDPAAGPHPPAAVTLPSLAEGEVRLALATIFTEREGTGPEGYAAGDFERAYVVGRAQLEVYLTWRDLGRCELDLRRLLQPERGTGEIRGGMGVAEPAPHSPRHYLRQLVRERGSPPAHFGILMENADPIRAPDELGWWRDRGVVAIGLAWAKSSRYAGGNSSQDGITPLGRELVKEMDRLGVVHDASHLSDRAFAELCELTDRPIIASHSNCRALLGDPKNQRHLTDDQIREIVRRGGVIGLNLYSKFLDASLLEGGRAFIDRAADHVEHICDLVGDRAHVGLGSDMDGGFAASRMPEGIERPRDLARLVEALASRGWSVDDVNNFACGNWVGFWSGTVASASSR
jgi:membrane dipeptidase